MKTIAEVDNRPIEKSQDMLKKMVQPRQSLIEVTIAVPLEEIDFSKCEVVTDMEPIEMWGAVETVPVIDVDLTGAEWMGEPVTFSEDDYEIAQQYVIRESRG